MILNSIRTAHCCILELLIFHPQLFSQRSAFTRSAPQISGIALHATTSLYIFSQHTHSGSRFHCHFPYITSAAVPRRRHFLQPFGLTSPLFFICSIPGRIHNGHHLVPHPQPTVSTQPPPWHHSPPTAPLPTVLSHPPPQTILPHFQATSPQPPAPTWPHHMPTHPPPAPTFVTHPHAYPAPPQMQALETMPAQPLHHPPSLQHASPAPSVPQAPQAPQPQPPAQPAPIHWDQFGSLTPSSHPLLTLHHIKHQPQPPLFLLTQHLPRWHLCHQLLAIRTSQHQ